MNMTTKIDWVHKPCLYGRKKIFLLDQKEFNKFETAEQYWQLCN